MNKEQQLIDHFYRAFQQRDHRAMAACYHPQAHFRDAVFDLNGEDIGWMWRMLCERAEDFSLTFSLGKQPQAVSADWQAQYRFSQTGRQVHNRIHARFRFKDGLIIGHDDDFSFWRWSRQALGLVGVFLGWTPLLHNKVKAQALANLQAFKAKNGG